MLRKICFKCKEEKDFCEFHKNKKTIDGYCFNCKECRKVKSKSDYYKNNERGKINTIIKTCSSCCVEKNISFFNKHVSSKDGYRSMCKECRSSNFKDEYNNGGDFTIKHKKRSEEYRKTMFEKCGYFNEVYQSCFEDVELNLKCLTLGFENLIDGNSVAYHYESQTRGVQQSNDIELKNDYQNGLVPFVNKNYDKLKKYIPILQ
jgi:hypothetical protein